MYVATLLILSTEHLHDIVKDGNKILLFNV